MSEIKIIRSQHPVVVVDAIDFDTLLEDARQVEPLRKQLSERLQQVEDLKDLIRRAVEWTPTFPLEASLADEMAKAIGYEVPQPEKPHEASRM